MKYIRKVHHHITQLLSQFLNISIQQKFLSLFITKMVMGGPFKLLWFINGINKKAEFTEKCIKTHKVFLINIEVKKLLASFSWNSIFAEYSDYVVNEFRGPQSWLFMKSRKYGNNQVQNV